jgi:hypothetical protein
MRKQAFRSSWLFALLTLSTLLTLTSLALAGPLQEGHPLSGTWSGDWGPNATQRNHLTFVMNWDGQKVTGTINPGLDSIPISSIFVDVNNWIIRIEADTKDQSGNTVQISAEGQIEELGSPHRKIVGTWRQGASKGDFRLTRE